MFVTLKQQPPRGRVAPLRLSVLTPFYNDDPTALLERLAPAPKGVEFILLADGACDPSLRAKLGEVAKKLGVPVSVLIWSRNQGRAAARNRLIEEAQGEYVLFLDADMLPDRPTFLRTWLSVTRCQAPDVAFGGLSLRHATSTPETALHHNLFGRSDCRSAEARSQAPAQFTASANLLVRRDFLRHHPFDSKFVGWGFEDVDWALDVSRSTSIMHVDNPATHAGLDTVDTLLRKSAEAGPNFARLAGKHPEVSRFAAHRTARLLKRLPARKALRTACAWIARDPHNALPMSVRRLALKLFRASHYAEHLA